LSRRPTTVGQNNTLSVPTQRRRADPGNPLKPFRRIEGLNLNTFRFMSAAPTIRDRFGYLPVDATLILESVGEHAMFAIITRAGGQRVSIPPRTRFPSDHPIVQAVGEELAEVVRAQFASKHQLHVNVPVLRAARAKCRDAVMASMRAKGARVSVIAREFGVTERTVYAALRRHRERDGTAAGAVQEAS